MKLSIKGMALSLGVVWGLSVFIITILALQFGYGIELLIMLTGLYPGFAISYPGAFLGLIYGFVDGVLTGLIVAWVYNRLTK